MAVDGQHSGHSHTVRGDADQRWLWSAFGLIVGFMTVEVVIGLLAGSLALLSDAAHMLTDAASLVLALVAMRLAAKPPRSGFTYGFRRAEILSAQINGLTLLLLAGWLGYQTVRRLIDPGAVAGGPVLATALVGVAVNLVATWLLSRANRGSLNVRGAFQHILNDLFAFLATALAGLLILLTGFDRADGIASAVVVVLMVKGSIGLLRDSGRIFLEAAPAGLDTGALGERLATTAGVSEVHDLHVWTITSGEPALSAHVLVDPGHDCHGVRREMERMLRETYEIGHTTLQVDHVDDRAVGHGDAEPFCAESHGPVHRAGGAPR